jgi:diacylglycerol kinase family enzyme
MGLSTVIILNPFAHGWRGQRQWARWEPEILRRLSPVELMVAESAAEAEQVAWNAAMGGIGRMAVVGDLLTAHGVVNAVMRLAEGHRRALKVGFLSLVGPDPWSHALNLPPSIDRQLEILGAAHVLPYDVGRVECVGPDGQPLVRHFIAGAALGRAMERDAGRPPSWLRTLDVVAGGLRDQLRKRLPQVRMTCDGVEVYRGPWVLGWAMQSQRYPGAGVVAAPADPADGALDVRWIGGGGTAGVAARLAGLLCRRPVGLAAITAREMRLDLLSGDLHVEADGLAVGNFPARVTAVHRALPVIVEAVANRLREKQKALLSEARGTALAGGLERASPSWRRLARARWPA